MMGAWHPKHVE